MDNGKAALLEWGNYWCDSKPESGLSDGNQLIAASHNQTGSSECQIVFTSEDQIDGTPFQIVCTSEDHIDGTSEDQTDGYQTIRL